MAGHLYGNMTEMWHESCPSCSKDGLKPLGSYPMAGLKQSLKWSNPAMAVVNLGIKGFNTIFNEEKHATTNHKCEFCNSLTLKCGGCSYIWKINSEYSHGSHTYCPNCKAGIVVYFY